MKLEVGKSYKNNLGDTVKIVEHTGSCRTYPYVDDKGDTYTEYGCFSLAGSGRFDLVKQVFVLPPLEVGGIYRDGFGKLVHIVKKRALTKEDAESFDPCRVYGKLSEVGSFLYRGSRAARYRYRDLSYYNFFYRNGSVACAMAQESLGDLVEFVGVFKPIETSASSFIEEHADNEREKEALRELLVDYLEDEETPKKPWWKIW